MDSLFDIVRDTLSNAIGGLVTAGILAVIATISSKFGKVPLLRFLAIATVMVIAVIALPVFGMNEWVAVIIVFAIPLLTLCAVIAFRVKRSTHSKRHRGNVSQKRGFKHVSPKTWPIFRQRNWFYPKFRFLGLIGIFVIPAISFFSIYQILNTQKTVILVANFDGPDPQKYGVNDAIIYNIRNAISSYEDLELETTSQKITEMDGSEIARKIGKRRNATIVIWGWYRTPGTVVTVSVHFEVLKPNPGIPNFGLLARGEPQTIELSEFESFKLQTKLSNEMAFLSLFTSAVTRDAVGDYGNSIKMYSDALQVGNQFNETVDETVVYHKRARAYINNKQYNLALSDLDYVISKDPNNAVAYNDRGTALFDLLEFSRAETDYRMAIKLDPSLFSAYMNLGTYLSYFSDPNESLVYLNQAAELAPRDTMVLHNRGSVYRLLKKNDMAMRDFNDAIKIDNQNPVLFYSRGVLYMDMFEYQKAIKDFSKAISFEDHSLFYMHRGASYMALKNNSRALKDLNTAIRLGENLDIAYMFRGILYIQMEQNENAKSDFKKVLEISKNPEAIEDAKEYINQLNGK